MAQMVKGVTSDTIGSNPVILLIPLKLDWKDENKEQEAGNGPIKKILASVIFK